MKQSSVVLLILLTILPVNIIPIFAQDTNKCEDGFRLFDRELLASEPVCIPENPERIAVQDIAAMELMYALDTSPVAVTMNFVTEAYTTLPEPFRGELLTYYEQFPDFGGIILNQEVLLEVDPDIILLNSFYMSADEEFIDQLSLIAPVIMTESVLWKESTIFWGDAINQLGEAQAVLEEYETRVQDFVNVTEGDLQGDSLALLMYSPVFGLNLNLPGSVSWTIPNDLGFVAPPELPQTPSETFETYGQPYPVLSIEELSLVNADHIVMMSASQTLESDTIETLMTALIEDPLWQNLDAVQNDQFYFTGQHWLAIGIVEAHIVIDEMFHFFTDENPEDVSPNPFMVVNIEVEATEEPSD